MCMKEWLLVRFKFTAFIDKRNQSSQNDRYENQDKKWWFHTCLHWPQVHMHWVCVWSKWWYQFIPGQYTCLHFQGYWWPKLPISNPLGEPIHRPAWLGFCKLPVGFLNTLFCSITKKPRWKQINSTSSALMFCSLLLCFSWWHCISFFQPFITLTPSCQGQFRASQSIDGSECQRVVIHSCQCASVSTSMNEGKTKVSKTVDTETYCE